MTDYRFEYIVELQKITGPVGKYGKAICKKCSQVHKCKLDEFELGTKEECYFVAKMRAWNCCHENEEPINEFPEPPYKDIEEWRK